jgi:DUF4097 and DUF4098 domain-containing protein YvlB
MQIRTILAASAMAATFTIGAAHAFAQSEEAREIFKIDRPTSGYTALDVSNINGAVRIVGSDDAALSIEGVKIVKSSSEGEAAEHLKEIEIVVGEANGALTLRSVHPESHDGTHYNVEFEIHVPRTWRVTATNVNGQITVEGMRAPVHASVTNGQIRTREVKADVTATVDNGQINGDVDVPSGGNLALTVTNGQIDSRLVFNGAANCTMVATNGEVKLALDDNASARVNASVEVGNVNVRDLTATNESRTRTGMVGELYSGTVGGGAATVGVTVSTGAVRIGNEK